MTGWRDRRAVLLLAATLLLSWALGSLAATCGRRVSTRSETLNSSGILGGQHADITDFPWQVSVLYNGQHLCGGSVLSEWWILTASHCFERKNKFLTIAHGIDDFNNQNSTKVKVAKLITHPYFDPWIMDNDVALLLLQSPLNLSVSTAPICLSEVTDMRRWRNCWVTGYGTTDPFHKQAVSAKLMKVDLKLINWDKCLHAISLITKNMICAGTPEGGKDACQSDSGGPLVCQKKKKSIWYQLGIVSWGVGCGLKDKPGVYTKVSSYLLWINTETKLAGKPYMHERDSGYSLLLSSWATLFLYFVILLLSW